MRVPDCSTTYATYPETAFPNACIAYRSPLPSFASRGGGRISGLKPPFMHSVSCWSFASARSLEIFYAFIVGPVSPSLAFSLCHWRTCEIGLQPRVPMRARARFLRLVALASELRSFPSFPVCDIISPLARARSFAGSPFQEPCE